VKAWPWLLLAVFTSYAPELLAGVAGSAAAWAYVWHGVEASALWLLACTLSTRTEWRAVCVYAATEAAMRPACRLALPMDAKPPVPEGSTLCEVAYGVPAGLVSAVAALCVAAILEQRKRP
jgi:hypothetical protein